MKKLLSYLFVLFIVSIVISCNSGSNTRRETPKEKFNYFYIEKRAAKAAGDRERFERLCAEEEVYYNSLNDIQKSMYDRY